MLVLVGIMLWPIFARLTMVDMHIQSSFVSNW